MTLLYCMGTIIPVESRELVLSRGFGIRNAIQLLGIKGSLDRFLGISLKVAGVEIPSLTFVLIAIICVFNIWIRKTKLGQEIRAVGQDIEVARTAGINVEKTRIISMILSTVLAGYGQLIYIQNIGTLATYNGTDSLALFSAASLLVGGATVNRATIPNVFIGTALFHLMFVVMPLAGNNLFGSAIIGEYFRVFISYAVITIALVIHAWNRNREKEQARLKLRNEAQ